MNAIHGVIAAAPVVFGVGTNIAAYAIAKPLDPGYPFNPSNPQAQNLRTIGHVAAFLEAYYLS